MKTKSKNSLTPISGSFSAKTVKSILFALFCFIASVTHASSTIFNAGIPLEKTAHLSETLIPLPDANPQILLAIAARHGKAKGQFTEQAALAMKQQFGKEIPIFIQATRIGKIPEQKDCVQVRLTFSTSPEYSSTYPAESIDMAVCPNR